MSLQRRNGRLRQVRVVDTTRLAELDALNHAWPSGPARCRICGDATHGQKPFCLNHLAHMESVARIRAEIASSQDRWARRARSRPQPQHASRRRRMSVTASRLGVGRG